MQENKNNKNYVVVFVHGWRNNADIGNGNVADLRVYAAHAARFVADRCGWGDQRFCNMKVTAVFVGWRGARTDENRIKRFFHPVTAWFCGENPRPGAGSNRTSDPPTLEAAKKQNKGKTCLLKDVVGDIGSIVAMITLFDRKPVSEAIAPSAISALQAIADQITFRTPSGRRTLPLATSIPQGTPRAAWAILRTPRERRRE